MDQIIQNQGLQHITEKILVNLPFEDMMAFQLVNKSTKDILDDPMVWIKKWISKGLSKKNQEKWIKTIKLMSNTNSAMVIILYIKKVLHRNRFVDMPCYIDEKTMQKFSNLTADDENSIRRYFDQACEERDAGSVQICIALVKKPNAKTGNGKSAIHNALSNKYEDIVQVLAPFIGNANDHTYRHGLSYSPIQYEILAGNTEMIKLLAPFCDDYFTVTGNWTLIHLAVWYQQAETIKILAPFMKDPNTPDRSGNTPIQNARSYGMGPNHDVIRILETIQ